MRDVFYTILIVWIIWRIFSGIHSYNLRQKNTAGNNQQNKRKEGETIVDYMPPQPKKKISDDEGEYVDYEEMK